MTGAAYVSAPQPSMETGQQVMDAQGMGYHHVGEYDSASQMYVQPGYASNTSVASGFAHPSTHTVDASTTNQGAGRGQPQRGGDAPRGRGRKVFTGMPVRQGENALRLLQPLRDQLVYLDLMIGHVPVVEIQTGHGVHDATSAELQSQGHWI